MEDAIEITAVMEVRLAWEWYVSWDWFWSQIQSLASWYCMTCCRTMIFRILCLGVMEFALGDEYNDVGGQGVNTLIG